MRLDVHAVEPEKHTSLYSSTGLNASALVLELPVHRIEVRLAPAEQPLERVALQPKKVKQHFLILPVIGTTFS